jgi:ABC-type phosphate transport system substrate-binding protein
LKKVAIIIGTIILNVFSYFLFAGENTTYRVVVHSTNPTETLSRKELSEIFLKKVPTWDHGQEVHPVDLSDNSLIRNDFTEEIHRKDIDKIVAYWSKEFFKNQKASPPQMLNELDVITYIESDSGAIGYISTTIPLEDYNVKVLNINQ